MITIIDNLPSFGFPSRKISMHIIFEIKCINDLTQADFKLNEFIQVEKNENEEDDEDENEEFNEKNKKTNKKINTTKQKKFFQKGPRMLCLILTNGKRDIKAIEYEPILKLTNENCKPGVKVLIKGLVEMSLTVLLLKPENIEIV